MVTEITKMKKISSSKISEHEVKSVKYRLSNNLGITREPLGIKLSFIGEKKASKRLSTDISAEYENDTLMFIDNKGEISKP